MSHAFMPWYIGDYLRDTGHLNTEQHGAYLLLLAHSWQHGAIPPSDAERAAIAKLTLQRWNKIKAPIVRFFNPDGTQKRVQKELERTERAIMQRRMAGKRGGDRSAISRSLKRGEAIADAQAELKREVKRNGSDRLPSAQARTEQPRTNHQESITSTSSDAPREGQEGKQAAGSLASAPDEGALTRPPETVPAAPSRKSVMHMSRHELDSTFHRKTYADLTKPPAGPCCVGWKQHKAAAA